MADEGLREARAADRAMRLPLRAHPYKYASAATGASRPYANGEMAEPFRNWYPGFYLPALLSTAIWIADD